MYSDIPPTSEQNNRLQKIEKLKDMGINPYPAEAYHPTHSPQSIANNYDSLMNSKNIVKISGKIFAMRITSSSAFIDLFDDGHTIQIFVNGRDADIKRSWDIIQLKLLDRGDFIGIEGWVFKTKTKQLSVNCQNLTILGKASHPVPLPKKQGNRLFDSISDKGYLYRHRHIDFLSNPSSRLILQLRSKIIMGFRDYLHRHGFMEVETPLLGNFYGGAAARPFKTELHALNLEMFLRISPECNLKRLLCAGFNKVYEIGKNCRNEGIDSTHNPEFTMLEFYEANCDYYDHMVRFENMISEIAMKVHGSTIIEYNGKQLNLSTPWKRLSMLDAIKEYAGIEVENICVEQMPEIFKNHHPNGLEALPRPLTWGSAVSVLFEDLVEKYLWEPTFILDHPLEISPLTKNHRDHPHLTERFEVFMAGMECGNAYSELNDPVEQYQRLISQQVAREDAYDLDHDFLQAMAHGMPQAAGTGIGIDRIVMLLTGAESIRNVIAFPFVSK